MDKCHAPTTQYLDPGSRGIVENVEMLELYHNGPCWNRILGRKAKITYEQALREMMERRENAMKEEESTKQIVELAKAGKTIAEIVEATGYDKRKVGNAVFRARKNGDIPSAKEQRQHKVEEIPAPASLPAGAFIAPIQITPSPDLSSLHAMIDLAAKLPTLKASILAACEEMEKSAQYQLYHVKAIREAVGA